ncbi:MAG: hypothetical protein AAFU64_08860, partial [Bacteroidota bacterium]
PQKAIILTPGYHPPRLDSLLKNRDSSLVLSIIPQETPDASIPSLASLRWHRPGLKEIILLGDGLASSDLEYLADFQTLFLPSPLEAGIIELGLPQEVYEDESFSIRGLIHTPHQEISRVVLEDPGGGIDSLDLDSQKRVQPFHLRGNSRESGQIRFKLILKDSLEQIIGEESLGLWVQAKASLEIRILNSFPNFESKYLKNWLGQEGHQVAIRSQISKNRYKDEYLNQAQTNLSLSEASLKNLDLLILDVKWLGNLSNLQWANIQKTVKERGMGLLIQGGESLLQSGLPRMAQTFPLAPALRKNTLLTSRLSGKTQKARVEVLALRFRQEDQLFPLIRGEQEEVLGAAQVLGLGQVALHLIPETYSLLLEDKDLLYAEYWSGIIQKLARKKLSNHQIRPLKALPRAKEALEISLTSPEALPELAINGPEESYQLPLRRDVFLKQTWTGKFWPQASGWYQAEVPEDSLSGIPFMVYPDSSWRVMKSYQLQKATQAALRSEREKVNEKKEKRMYQYQPIPLWIFYGLALLSLGFLWLEEKL